MEKINLKLGFKLFLLGYVCFIISFVFSPILYKPENMSLLLIFISTILIIATFILLLTDKKETKDKKILKNIVRLLYFLSIFLLVVFAQGIYIKKSIPFNIVKIGNLLVFGLIIIIIFILLIIAGWKITKN